MMKRVKEIKNPFFSNIPRWLVLQTDLFVSVLSMVFAFLLRFNFDIPANYWEIIAFALPTSLAVKGVAFYYTKSYAGIIRFTSVEDAKRIVLANSLSFVLLIVINFSVNVFVLKGFIPISVLVIDYALAILFMSSFRVLAKILYYEWKSKESSKLNVIIYGAGEAGQITAKTLNHDASVLNIVAFVDDNKAKVKSRIEGVKIYSQKDFEKVAREKKVDQLIIAIQNISPNRKSSIIERGLALGLEVKSVPPVQNWINGELSSKQIREVKIEDILGRDTIDIDKESISSELRNKVILVTGAAGSIGSELVRQISIFKPKCLILLDQAETPLYELELELLSKNYKINFEVVIGDVCNEFRMKKIFEYYKPQYVFHAAAYKHVPMMEENPSEAVLVNVFGTKVVADCAVKHQVEKFVLVSTDKAVNPTNVMGASKRLAELYTQSLNNFLNQVENGTKFITTRFGNVLGSNGSVIPRFRNQILEGGPVTITHPEITRYFMTIPEASQLVLEAGSMGNGGEVFLFDMGEPIKIIDLAKKMIKLSGFELGKDIQIKFTGLRPGEKLYEELLTENENTIATHHPKIMIGKFKEYDYESIEKHMLKMKKIYDQSDNKLLVTKMKEIIPEYKSRNSVFEALD